MIIEDTPSGGWPDPDPSWRACPQSFDPGLEPVHPGLHPGRAPPRPSGAPSRACAGAPRPERPAHPHRGVPFKLHCNGAALTRDIHPVTLPHPPGEPHREHHLPEVPIEVSAPLPHAQYVDRHAAPAPLQTKRIGRLRPQVPILAILFHILLIIPLGSRSRQYALSEGAPYTRCTCILRTAMAYVGGSHAKG